MKRKTILIGNTRGLLSTPIDLFNVAQFLMSYQGGAWEKSEIELLLDRGCNELLLDVDRISGEKNDYVIVYFSGHGGLQGDTILEVNPQGELIKESSLFGLADRQLNILDCCRIIHTTPLPIYGSSRGLNAIDWDLRDAVRTEYEELVTNASPQLVRMYSCSEGESSYPSKQGSYYTNSLLSCAKDLLQNNNIVWVCPCHEAAAMKTADEVRRDLKENQHPEIIPAKCLSMAELPFCFNPKSLK
ncbi:MAG: hypothetical protein IKO75_05225 [Bacteroidales bacterium]|nr:hypothetical protein [Bacteroidales bacterium]